MLLVGNDYFLTIIFFLTKHLFGYNLEATTKRSFKKNNKKK